MRYRVYAHTLDSKLELELARDATDDLREGALRLRAVPLNEPLSGESLVHDEPDGPGLASLRVWIGRSERGGRGYRVEYGAYSFRSQEEDAIEVAGPPDPSTLTDLVVRSVLPIHFTLFRAHSFVALHAGGFALGPRCALVIGPSGVGKSTCASASLARGAKFVCDDLALIDVAHRTVLPAPARARLWQERAAGATSRRAVRGSGGRKRVFEFPASRRIDESIALGAILCLARASGGSRSEPLRGARAMAEVLASAFELHDAPRLDREARLRAVSSLVRSTPVWRITYEPGDPERPAQLEAALGALSQIAASA